MTNKNLRKIATIVAILTIAGISSSCNRGYGCPGNFSMNDSATTIVTWVINLVK